MAGYRRDIDAARRRLAERHILRDPATAVLRRSNNGSYALVNSADRCVGDPLVFGVRSRSRGDDERIRSLSVMAMASTS